MKNKLPNVAHEVWFEFLDARMLVIIGCIKEGKSIDEIKQMVGMGNLQMEMLYMEAESRIQKENQGAS